MMGHLDALMPLRFVILHHTVSGGEHWDLMLEQGNTLLTWQLLREPFELASLPIPARRIGDHRKAYLDYEGSLSRNRGDVRRVDEGSIEFEESTDDGFVFCLRGSRLAGRFSLTLQGDTWMLNRVG